MSETKFNRYKRDLSERKAIFDYSSKHGQRAAADHFKISIQSVKCVRRHFKPVAHLAQEKLGVTATAYRTRCLKYAYTKGLWSQVEQDEFASYAVLQFLERGLNNPEWAFSEHCRYKFGRTIRSSAETHESRQAFNEPLSTAVDRDLVAVPAIDEPDTLIEFPKSIDGMLACLVIKWGFSQKELADMMGRHETAIHFRIKPVIEAMKSKYGK
jgi:hypothetical protein